MISSIDAACHGRGTLRRHQLMLGSYQMAGQLCVPVEYRYMRKPIPKSQLWHLNCYKTAEKPANRSPGVLDVSDVGGDHVSIFFAVPCNERAEVDAETQAKYEDLADKKFKEIRPDAEMA